MEIRKETQAANGGVPTEAQLAAINGLSKANLTAEQVYVFSLRLCDDQVDRDGERFDTGALPQLARLFLGKTGVLDHNWRSDCQVARIFSTETLREEGVTYIKAWAYIRRGGHGDELIADIEAGIKKEVSVGCAMGRSVCSVCGSDYGTCGHQKGQCYDGETCCAILKEPMDAYEFSFVAVPAQRSAGVLKGFAGGQRLQDLAQAHGAQGEYRQLWKQAQLGLQYEQQLRESVVRLCMALELSLPEPVLRHLAGSVGAEDLQTLKTALEQQLAPRMPVESQLLSGEALGEELESGFLI